MQKTLMTRAIVQAVKYEKAQSLQCANSKTAGKPAFAADDSPSKNEETTIANLLVVAHGIDALWRRPSGRPWIAQALCQGAGLMNA